MQTDRELFDQGKKDQLCAQLFSRTEREVQTICGRLVGMGRCINTCPDSCQEFSEIGHQLVITAVEKALKSPQWGDEGILFVTVADDDFRRPWNSMRGLVMELLQNKFLRAAKGKEGVREVTPYGKRFYKHARNHPVLKTFGSDEKQACRIFQSWLANLWDDACDNAEMSLSVTVKGSSEKTYCHPKRILDNRFRRHGYRADRVHRRRTSVKNEREIDALLPPEWRPLGRWDGIEESVESAAYQKQLKNLAVICDALFEIVEKTDEDKERFATSPIPDGTSDFEHEFTKRNISFRAKDGKYEISMDDADRNDDGFVNSSVFSDDSPPNNRWTLFDDFVEAWVLTRGAHRKGDVQHTERVLRDDQPEPDFDEAPVVERTPKQYITVDEYPSNEIP